MAKHREVPADVKSEVSEKANEIKRMFPNLNVEIRGYWIWIDGDTKPNREALRTRRCFWSKKQQKWFWKHPKSPNYKYKRKWPSKPKPATEPAPTPKPEVEVSLETIGYIQNKDVSLQTALDHLKADEPAPTPQAKPEPKPKPADILFDDDDDDDDSNDSDNKDKVSEALKELQDMFGGDE